VLIPVYISRDDTALSGWGDNLLHGVTIAVSVIFKVRESHGYIGL